MKFLRGMTLPLLLLLSLSGLSQTGMSMVAANPTAQPRVAKSLRHRTRGTRSRGQSQDYDPLDSKKSLAEMLHYNGLEDPPEMSQAQVPEYVQLAFQFLDDSTYEYWQHNQAKHHSRASDETIWAIEVHEAITNIRRDAQMHFRIQNEVFLVNRSRVELVFPHHVPDMMGHRLQQVSLCSGGSTYRTCQTEFSKTSDTVLIENHIFHVYNITALFQSWILSREGEARPLNLLVNFPRRRGHLDWSFTRSTNHEPLLVIYSNLQHFLLKDYIVTTDYRAPVDAGRHQRRMRLRRSLPQSRSDSSDYYEYNPSSTGPTSGPFASDPPYCSLIDWYIDFSVIGWDSFIIEPEGYHGNLCLGSCDIPILGNQLNITNHAFIKNLYQLEMLYGGRSDLGLHVPKVTCIPHRIDPISIIFKSGRDTFVSRRLGDMRVTMCVCM